MWTGTFSYCCEVPPHKIQRSTAVLSKRSTKCSSIHFISTFGFRSSSSNYDRWLPESIDCSSPSSKYELCSIMVEDDLVSKKLDVFFFFFIAWSTIQNGSRSSYSIKYRFLSDRFESIRYSYVYDWVESIRYSHCCNRLIIFDIFTVVWILKVKEVIQAQSYIFNWIVSIILFRQRKNFFKNFFFFLNLIDHK